ncbi:OLC1v1020519C2 [Oldenlandia corymbosa var. corymbosa]|nr:OLC1v1020519C2 [Oldenlandia corymbosa var. corymbosa]
MVEEGSNKVTDFPHFDVLSGDSAYSDHHYNQSNKSRKVQGSFSNPNSNVSKTIAKEWRILQKNLPESIYVRAYENRMDLLRAVIIGSPGTPYHDGLFFFDIVLPSDYPNQPPKVYYHSHGMRLNPNLYNSGYVCLSLLKTWYGAGVELWTKNSTLLQLLVSLQGLVLNDKPYFNEPAYGKGLKNMNESWRKASMAYNEDVFIYSCKTMLHKMKNPPKGFEDFVAAHFRSRGESILAAITAYKNGEAILGQYKKEAVVGATVSTASNLGASKKFRSNLSKIHSDLKSALRTISHSAMMSQNGKEKCEEVAAPDTTMAGQGSAERKPEELFGKFLKFLKRTIGC